MSLEFALLVRFLQENQFQPATDPWRSVEVAYMARRGLPAGRDLDVAVGTAI